MKTILLTGFEVWEEHPYNSSWEVLRDREIPTPPGWRVETLRLPVSWRRAPTALAPALARRPDAVVAFGQFGGERVRLERLAANLHSLTLTDIDGLLSPDEFVVSGGPAAYYTRLPWRALLDDLAAAEIPVETSTSAGSFLCNAVSYLLLHQLAATPTVPCGLVHVPTFDDLAGLPKAQLQDAVDRIVARVCAKAETAIGA